MGELSFLTIVVSLAVCSLLTYAIFQYMKVRLSILEQSHKEQALILQQYIEESSTDIHRLYRMNTDSRQGFPQSNGSIILEYANEMMNEKQQQYTAAHNEPHTIHLDTAAFFHNSRGSGSGSGSGSKLIEISSDSEDTTDTDTDTSDTDTDTDTDTSDTETDAASDMDMDTKTNNNDTVVAIDPIEITDVSTTEIKTVSVDLGSMQEPSSPSKEHPAMDVLSLLYKKEQEEALDNASATAVDVSPATHAPSAATSVPLSAMSVSELKNLLKEKCKNQPEKHAEIQRLKKAELIYAIQQL
jgi:hypothetical protein